METLKFDSAYFDAELTLLCGQTFRYHEYQKGYIIISLDKACYIYTEGNFTYLETDDMPYFINYFDLDCDYKKIYNYALSLNNDFLATSAITGKGIRILHQNPTEMIFSFIVSQNNFISRIRKTIENLCTSLGEKKVFLDFEYYSFPSVDLIASKSVDFYKSLGLGYRASYIFQTAKDLEVGFDIDNLTSLSTKDLKKELLRLKGVGGKVADCISLFGFYRTDSFPVDTWIEKVYYQNFESTTRNAHQITEYFLDMFKDYSGYIQQYIFNYKRNIENKK